MDLFVAGQTDIKQQGNTAVLLEPQPLRDGVEFANVQRVFEESKTFQFSAPNRITSPRDVAYIFKQLETSSVENAFAVLVKDHKPTVIHLAIGTFSRVMVTMEPIMAADKRIHADEIYFIHNHPSGKVVASNADMVTYTTMRQIFGERLQPGIIINTRSGNYGMFTSDNPAIGPEAIATDENQTYAIPTYSFSKLVFSQNYREAGFVRNSMDVASFVSGQRLGDRQKLSYIILSNSNEIQANVHTHYSKLTAPDYMPLAKRMADDIITYGGASIITYGSCTLNASEVRRLQKNLRETAPSESGNVLLDHINIKSNINVGLTSSFAAAAEKTYSYESASDEGWLREPCERYAISSPAEHEEIQGIALTRKEIKELVQEHVEALLAEADMNVGIADIEIHGSRGRGNAKPDSDLDVVIEYRGDMKEDGIFNILNEEPLYIDGVRVDINPIRPEETGTLAQYMERSREYDANYYTYAMENRANYGMNRKKSVISQSRQLDLFSALDDDITNSQNHERTDMEVGSGEAGRQRQQREPNPSLGRNESGDTSERPIGGGMRGSVGMGTSTDQRGSQGIYDASPDEQRIEQPQEDLHKNTRNNRAKPGVDYCPKGVDARIKANIAAIELSQQLLDNDEEATVEQMAVLRQYSGWGGLGKAFNDSFHSEKLKSLLGEDGYEAAQMSRNSAYFTPPYVVEALWNIAEGLGFKGGNVLEGSAGIGNILGLMPQSMNSRSNIHAVEIEPTTSGILSLLYPDAKVERTGFEKTVIPNGSIDLSITNVPFVPGLRVNDTGGDKDLSQKFHDLHDFCISKNVRKLREGGIGIFITTSGSLDGSHKLRSWLTNEGNSDVIGAFRMNNETFGGTAATADIIVVRKRIDNQKSVHAIDVGSTLGVRTVDYDTGGTRKGKGEIKPIIKKVSLGYNKYFVEHPEYMGGEMFLGFEKGDTYRPTGRSLYPVAGKDQRQLLLDWSRGFAAKRETLSQTQRQADAEVSPTYEALGAEVKEGNLLINGTGQLCIAQFGQAVPLQVNANNVRGHSKIECFNDYSKVKEALRDVLDYQTDYENDEGLPRLLKDLNWAFDKFVMTYGHFHKNTAISFLKNDVDFPSISALETVTERMKLDGTVESVFGKTDIFSRRVIEKETELSPESVKDGVVASIYKFGRVNVGYIAAKLNKTTEDVKRDIIASGLGFENPLTTQIEASYEYLSGNVREKLYQAQANNTDGRYDTNIKALEKVLPMDVPAHLIEFALGASWIEPKLYEDYVKDKTGLNVNLIYAGGTWIMNTPYTVFNEQNRGFGVNSELCGKMIFGHQLIEAALQNRTITISKTSRRYDNTVETITDKEATMACTNKIEEIRQDFKDWSRGYLQAHPDLATAIEKTYNDRFNNSIPKVIPEDYAPENFIGAAKVLNGREFTMRQHQSKAVVRSITQPFMLAHEVGTGKTFTLITTAMEMRRLGTARKPMIVVQNATVGQFVDNIKALYPNAKLLTIEDAERNAEGRKNFYAKIKYNDWDMVVVPQSVFDRIPDSEERQRQYIEDIIEEKTLVLEKLRQNDSQEGTRHLIRQLEADIAKQEDGLTTLSRPRDQKRMAVVRQNAQIRAEEMLDRATDDFLNFDELGIDALLIDEAHEYKHLGFSTAMQRGIKGIDPSYSKKSQSLYLKTRSVFEKNNWRNVVFATGTPISNTAAEIWTFMRYLTPPDTLKGYGIYYFDDFVRNFGNLQQMMEFSTNGKFKENNRFAGYVNLPELVRIWSGVSDTVLTDEAGGVKDKIPQIEGGKAQDIYLPQTRALRSVMKYVKEELDAYDRMSGAEKKRNSHIPLVMYGIAKAAAVDARLVVADAQDEPNSKTNEAVRQTLLSLKETESYKGTVAIFADMYQNKNSGFNLYEDIQAKLIAEGVSQSQIVIMKSGMSVKKKLEIFDRVNRGDIRVIMGSTFTLGTGVNIQERLHTLIHVDAPNRPMDYTQRNGRIARQGNLHKEMGIPIRILRFGVEDSLDVTAYQRLKTKSAIVDAIMRGKGLLINNMENRTIEEAEDVFGDITAQLSGSEYALLCNQAEREVRKYTNKLKQWEQDQIYIHRQIPRLQGQKNEAAKRLDENRKNLELVERLFPQGNIHRITIGDNSFHSLDDMADFIKDHNVKINEMREAAKQGHGVQKRTMKIAIDSLEFTLHTEVYQKMDNNGQLSFSSEGKMTYSCPQLALTDVPVDGVRLKAAMEDILGNVVTGKDFRERISAAKETMTRKDTELQTLQERNGKPFQFGAELEAAKQRLGEYTEKMKVELEQKEAKYAELDKTIDTATGVSSVEYDNTDNEQNEIQSEEPMPQYNVTNETDLRFRRNWYGGNSGYMGYSMSQRAVAAREDGRFPKTDFKKEYGITDKSLVTLMKLGLIDDSEWHHTSKFGNKTTFYGWQDEASYDTYKRNKKEIDRLSRDYSAAMEQALGGNRPPFLSEFDLAHPDMNMISNNMLVYLQYSVHKKATLTDKEKASFKSRHEQVSQSGAPIEERSEKHREIEAEEMKLSNAREAEIRKELRDTEDYHALIGNIKNRIEAFHQAQSTLDEIKNLINQMDIRTRFIGEQGAANLDKAEEATTRLDNLAVARDMETAGKNAKTVKMTTGWERGADGKWRYEVDDNLDGVQFKTQEDLLKEYRQAKRESDTASWKWQFFSDKNPALRYRTSKKNSQEENDRLVQQREKAKKRERELFAENMRLRDIAWESQKRLEDGLNGVSLRELLGENHPLLTAYPEMDEIEVSFYSSGRYINSSSYGGYYAPKTRSIFINTDTTADRMRSTLAHELQHAIQHIEGFARGGNYKAGYELAKRMDKLTDDQREFVDSIRIYNDWKAKGNLREDYSVSEYMRGLHDVFSEDFFRDISIMTDEEIQHEYNRLSEKSSYERMTAYEAYKNISGEVEARNVQCRMNMTAEERRASLASETEDVAREDQIFLNEVLGTAAFVKADDIKKAPMERSTGASSNEAGLRTNHQDPATPFELTANIRKNLDILMHDCEENKVQSRNFIGSISSALELCNNGNNSRYGTFKAKNGVEFRLRISDHNAASKNFDDAGYKDGLSIVVSRKPNKGITNNGEAHITEYYYNAYKLAKAEGRPLADIARSLQQALYSGEYKDLTGLAERHEVNAEELADRLSSPIRIVKADEIRHSNPDREKRLRDTKGWYDASTGEVFVVFDNIVSVNDFKQTVLHEVVGHKGLRAVVGQKAFGTLCESVYRSMPISEQRTYLKRYGSRSIAGEEYMANLAEQDAHQNTPAWNKVTTAVKVALNSIGIQVDYSIGEMRELLRRSTRQLERTLDSTIKKVPVRVNGVKLDKGTRRQLALGHSVVLDLPDKKTGQVKPVRLSWSEKQGLTGRPSLGGQKHKI